MYLSKLFNVSSRKFGSVRFVKIGRLTISWCVGREYRPFKSEA